MEKFVPSIGTEIRKHFSDLNYRGEPVYTHLVFDFYNEDIHQAVITTKRGTAQMAKIWPESSDLFRITGHTNNPPDASIPTLDVDPMYEMNAWHSFRLTTRWDAPFDSANRAEFSVYIDGERMDGSGESNTFYNAYTSLKPGELDLINFNLWTPSTQSMLLDDLRVECSTNPLPQSATTPVKEIKTFNTIGIRTWRTTPVYLDDIGIWGGP